MRQPNTEEVVTYVSPTPFGPAFLPAQVRGILDGKVTLAIFCDMAGGSEWFVEATYSEEALPGTWSYGKPFVAFEPVLVL